MDGDENNLSNGKLIWDSSNNCSNNLLDDEIGVDVVSNPWVQRDCNCQQNHSTTDHNCEPLQAWPEQLTEGKKNQYFIQVTETEMYANKGISDSSMINAHPMELYQFRTPKGLKSTNASDVVSSADAIELESLLCQKCKCDYQKHSPSTLLNDKSICAVVPEKLKSPKQLTFWKVFRHHFVRYCETTSLRGVPKIVKSRDWKRRMLWSCFVFGFFVGCIICLAFMVFQFLNYDVIHQPRTIVHEPTEFPAFTVCNTRPFSEHGMKYINENGFMDPQAFLSALMSMAQGLKFNRNKENKTLSIPERDALSNAMLLPGYLRIIDDAKISLEQVGHNLSTTIIDCNAVMLEDEIPKSISCDHIGKWVRVFSESYINCYSYHARTKEIAKSIKHIEFFVYLEDQEKVYCQDCSKMQLPSQLSGVRVELHTSGTYPNIFDNGMNLLPGTFTEIRFKTKQWKMMEPPYGKCLRKASHHINFNQTKFNFSEDACRNAEIQYAIMKKCGCKFFRLPIEDKYLELAKELRWCGIIPPKQFNAKIDQKRNLSLIYDADLQIFFERQKCAMSEFQRLQYRGTRKTDDYYLNRVNKCHTACEYYTYDNFISSTKWPTASYRTQFKTSLNIFRQKTIRLRNEGKNPTTNVHVFDNILKKMTMYDEIDKLAKTNISEAWRKLSETDFIERNFLAIIVARSDFEIVRVEEKAVFTLTSLLSQSGGLLSIWIGLTFICIVEMFELILNIFDTYSQQKFTD